MCDLDLTLFLSLKSYPSEISEMVRCFKLVLGRIVDWVMYACNILV